jgi:hypothetical protein
MSPDKMRQWLLNGAVFDDLFAPGLEEDLSKLKRGESVINPRTGSPKPSGKWIIFEMPLGREYRVTAPYIDFLIWIDTPLDMALARKIREFIYRLPPGAGEKETRAFLSWLGSYLDNYIELVGKMLDLQKERVPIHADLILDGRKDLETLVRVAVEAIRKRFPG